MKLTYRDAITTALAGLVVAVTLAVTQEWAWPMLGNPRAGIIAVGILGVAMCSIGTRSEDMATKDAFVHHPGMIVGSALGALALALLVAGVIAGTEALLIVIAGVLLLLWGVATIRHAGTPTPISRFDGGALTADPVIRDGTALDRRGTVPERGRLETGSRFARRVE